MPDRHTASENDESPEQDASAQAQALSARFDRLEAAMVARMEELKSDARSMREVLALLLDDDPGTRRRLYELREHPSYEEAFSSVDPLVSIVIPTWNRPELLVDRAIRSALGQTHSNIEVIVVGDASPPDTEAAVAAVRDPRVSFHNLTIRGPYAEDKARAWLASGTPGLNAGVRLARGRWIAPLGDDDEFVPAHVEQLLAAARTRRLEFVYGRIHMIRPDGVSLLLGEFPPRMSQIGLQAALYHSGLRFMELELGHATMGVPNDWGLVHRMMRVGVRMGMVDEVTVNYWASERAPGLRHAEASPGADDSDLNKQLGSRLRHTVERSS